MSKSNICKQPGGCDSMTCSDMDCTCSCHDENETNFDDYEFGGAFDGFHVYSDADGGL